MPPIKKFESVSGKLTIIAFINAVTEAEINTFQLWNNITDEIFNFVIINFSSETLPEELSNFKQILGTEEIKENFEIDIMPWSSILYESYEISSASLQSCNVSFLQKLLNLYSPYESFHIYSLPSLESISVWDYDGQKEKNINLNDTVLLDFWDDSSPEILLDPLSSSTSASYFQIYSGIQTPRKRCRYGLGAQGISHPTATQLKIIEIPTTIILKNGKIIWKGNRQFTNFEKILKSHFDGSNFEIESTKITPEDIENVKVFYHKKVQQLNDVKIEAHFYSQCEISSYKIHEEKYWGLLKADCKLAEEKIRISKLAEKIKSKLPNFKYFISCDEKIEEKTEKNEEKTEKNDESNSEINSEDHIENTIIKNDTLIEYPSAFKTLSIPIESLNIIKDKEIEETKGNLHFPELSVIELERSLQE